METKKRILFVDDEPRILEGIQDLMRPRRREWDMVFAVGGQAGLDEMAKTPFDVIVSDIRMPGIDGATLLSHVQNKYPKVVRILLSGEADPAISIKAIQIAHQYLGKPCDPDRLRSAINRACDVQRLLCDESLLAAIGKIKKLPSVPQLFMRLREALCNPAASANDIAGIIERDPAMALKVIQLVNSAYFGLDRRVTNIREAVTYIGFEMLKNLTLTAEIFAPFDTTVPLPHLTVEGLQQHALLAANIAQMVVADDKQREEAFLAGMLHDFGLLILASRFPARLGRALTKAHHDNLPLFETEAAVFGTTHAEVGAYFLGLWGLSYPVIEAIAFHHRPTAVQDEGQGADILAAVHIAHGLAQETLENVGHPVEALPPVIDLAYLERRGLTERLDEWRLSVPKFLSIVQMGD